MNVSDHFSVVHSLSYSMYIGGGGGLQQWSSASASHYWFTEQLMVPIMFIHDITYNI